MITSAQVKAIAGAGARPALVSAIVGGWPSAVAKAKLTTKLRAAHFLAQIMTETGGLQILEESGAYSASRMMVIFGEGRHSANITPAEARRIAALPVSQRGPVLFNRVYGVGNLRKMREFNNTGANDGWLYRGGGMMQATGKSNYAAMEKKTGLPLVAHPELLHQPASAFTAAYLEWIQDGRCNAAADRDDVVAVRRIINGGSNGLAECKVFLAKAKKVLADYSAAPAQSFVAEPEIEPQFDAADTAAAIDEIDQGPAPAGEDTSATPAAAIDDPALYAVKRRLKAMNYNCGVLNGEWGGMTAGAIAGFINDRGGQIAAPASLAAFNEVREEIRAELQRAEDENPPFVRPVSEARKNADPAIVDKVAPEVVPVRRNFLLTAWTAVGTFFAGIVNSASDYISQAWDFVTDHKEDLPSDPGFLSSAWQYLGEVPALVWWTLAALGIGVVAFNSWSGVKKITEQVKTGARQ
ncbi:glycoside hydrolase family 19 protein [Bradyrhizobium sp. JYMT SZCCT0428]|uniref:glycoside hydrolase family 19 protein n=1 Tax=Bradyrhizobium sp. JYMT SZCCT0428 TaxID=2807673 RepID=UPI001BA9102A|nr:glycoside hydrolase family 19 protein [Bradyrhizobium sp. JYMT SZCCT0428]MBR1150070.1 glycoside hydrolase family 19 protein [Bradyrhizobium sp. JYMT SZCCT0428]